MVAVGYGGRVDDDRRRRALLILGEVERALVDIRCDGAADCCRFAVTGREPWLTSAEWQLVVAEVRRQGRRLPAPHAHTDGRCPFLADSGRCQVYAARPLGCRSHFCERAAPPAPHASAFRTAARELAALSTGDDDERSRPITSWLAASQPAAARARRRR